MYINGRRVCSSDSIIINGDAVKPEAIDCCIKYLGAPIAAKRDAKMRFSDDLLLKVKHQINQILLSPLTVAQCLNAIKKLIIPKLDFIFMNGVVSRRDVSHLDENIRGLLQKKLNCSGLPIEIVHAH